MLGVLFASICTNSAAKLYHFAIPTKNLLTFLLQNFNQTDTLLDFCSFPLLFEIFQPLSFPDSLHIVILQKNEGRCVRTQRPFIPIYDDCHFIAGCQPTVPAKARLSSSCANG